MNELGSTTPSVTYDAAELRLRIAGCFSVPELRQLAESLGVGAAVTWDRGAQEAARDLVKQFERFYGLETLVAKLRELRPLVEWPEPQVAAAPAPSPFAPPAPAPVSASAPSPFAPPAPAPASAPSPFAPALSSPGTLGAPKAVRSEPPEVGPILQDPMMPPAAPPSRAASHWPGITGAPAEPSRSRGIDPRIFIAVAGLMVVAALIAYLAGRASNSPAPDATNDAARSSSTAPRPKRADGPALRLSAALTRTLAAVGRVCEVPASTPKDAQILERAFEQCGPVAAPERLSGGSTSRTPPPSPPPPSPPVDRPPSRGGGNAGAKDTPKAPSNPCMSGCESSFRSCKDGCGAEPTQSSQYDSYQLCRGRCLTAQSRCRLGCPQ